MAVPNFFASHIDVLSAGQRLEDAIHASTWLGVVVNIDHALEQLRHAKSYFEDYGDEHLVEMTGDAIKQLESLNDKAKSEMWRSPLRAFQSGPLYSYQGVLGELDAAIRLRM